MIDIFVVVKLGNAVDQMRQEKYKFDQANIACRERKASIEGQIEEQRGRARAEQEEEARTSELAYRERKAAIERQVEEQRAKAKAAQEEAARPSELAELERKANLEPPVDRPSATPTPLDSAAEVERIQRQAFGTSDADRARQAQANTTAQKAAEEERQRQAKEEQRAKRERRLVIVKEWNEKAPVELAAYQKRVASEEASRLKSGALASSWGDLREHPELRGRMEATRRRISVRYGKSLPRE